MAFVENKKPSRFREGFVFLHRVEEISVFGRPGSDLLFQALRLSTIGAGEFNGRVRDGIGFRLPANTTRPAKDDEARAKRELPRRRGSRFAKLVDRFQCVHSENRNGHWK